MVGFPIKPIDREWYPISSRKPNSDTLGKYFRQTFSYRLIGENEMRKNEFFRQSKRLKYRLESGVELLS